MAKKTMTIGFLSAGMKSNSTSVGRSSLSKSQGKSRSKASAGVALSGGKVSPEHRSIKTGTFVLEKPGKGITMKESRQRMLKQLDGSFKRLA
jgi:hypothetical protein